MTSPLRLRRDYGEDRVATGVNENAMESLSNKPNEISLPWGTPPKPNLWKAKRQGDSSRYIVTSPVLRDDHTYVLLFSTKYFPRQVSFHSFDQNGYGKEIHVRSYSFSEVSLKDMLMMFWGEMRQAGINKYLTVPKVASSRVPAVTSLSNLPDTLTLPWGTPPKPNLWMTKKIGSDLYRVTSPVLTKRYAYTLQLGANEFKFSALSKRVGYDIYDCGWTRDEVEQDTLEELLETFWRYMRSHSNRHGGSEGINKYLTVPKVASSQEIPAATTLDNLPAVLALPWGTPPKPNLWVAQKISPDYYQVKSPVLDPKFLYQLNLDRNSSSRFRIRFNAINNNLDIKELQSGYIHKEVLKKNSLNDLLKQFWRRLSESGALTQYLTVPKVASRNPSSIRDIIDHEPKKFELAWGTPPKKNLWEVDLDYSSTSSFPVEEKLRYTVRSPILNTPLSIHFTFNYSYVNIKVRVGKAGDDLFAISYDKNKKIKSLDHPLDIFTEAMWRYMVKTGQIQEHLKPNLKVASALSHIRNKQVYGLRSLSSPSSQTGLFFYPVQQHRSQRATRHAFYLNDNELSIMRWQGSEWSRVSSIILRRQQSEILFRLLRTIANSVEDA